MTRDDNERRSILDRLPEAAKLAMDLERLKDLERQNPLAISGRRELVAEHSWHVAVAVVLLADFSAEPIDLGRATLLATVHDVVEAFVGDTFAFGPDAATKDDREHAAMTALRESTPDAAIHTLVQLWEEYEAQETSEARFVKAIDAFLPIVMNFTNIDESSWVAHGVAAAQVTKRLDRVRDAMGELASINDSMIEQAQRDGDLR